MLSADEETVVHPYLTQRTRELGIRMALGPGHACSDRGANPVCLVAKRPIRGGRRRT